MLCVVSLTARLVYLPSTFGPFYHPRSLNAIAGSVILRKSVLIVVNTWNLKPFVLHFDLEMLPCCNYPASRVASIFPR